MPGLGSQAMLNTSLPIVKKAGLQSSFGLLARLVAGTLVH